MSKAKEKKFIIFFLLNFHMIKYIFKLIWIFIFEFKKFFLQNIKIWLNIRTMQ